MDQRPEGWTGAYPLRSSELSVRDPRPLSEEHRPIALRPEVGVVVSANQGGQGPERDRWCSYPEPHYRFERITELLAERPLHDKQSMLAISYDPLDPSARRLLPVWCRLLPDHPMTQALEAWAANPRARELLGLFHRLHEEVCFGLLAEDIGWRSAERFREWSALVFYQQRLDSLLALEEPELLSAEALRSLLQDAFAKVMANPAHAGVPVRLRFQHILTRGKSPAWLGFDSPEVELPGTPVSPFQSRASPVAGETLVYGPSFHLLFDMSGPHAWYNLPGGASESRFGPGYGQGLAEWLTGTLLPLGRDAAAGTIRLER
jgi:acyl-homoserine lactone acylase PvdQ